MRLMCAGEPGRAHRAPSIERPAVSTRRFLIPSLALAASLAFAACGSDEPAALDIGRDVVPATSSSPAPAGEQLPDTPAEDVAAERGDQVSTPAQDRTADIQPAEGAEAPAEQVVTGRVVRVDRDGPSVEVVESTILTGTEATEAARDAGAIGPDEEWTEDHFVMEGQTRWVDIDPTAVIGVYDCTQACEHVEGTLEHVLSGAPHGGTDAVWAFVMEDGRATSVEELYLP